MLGVKFFKSDVLTEKKIMGFSSALQGASSHDAILSRVDAELRLLENMKRCLTARVKADREYAIALNSFVLQVIKYNTLDFGVRSAPCRTVRTFLNVRNQCTPQ